MDYILDTNVLLRYVERNHPLHQVAFNSVANLQSKGCSLFVLPQNCIEFWNVCTRPLDRNGFGKTPSQADVTLLGIENLFVTLTDIPSIYDRWRQLVVQFNVSGVQVHDARIVAAMMAHGVSSILTFNTTDFTRYSTVGITAVDPNSLAV